VDAPELGLRATKMRIFRSNSAGRLSRIDSPAGCEYERADMMNARILSVDFESIKSSGMEKGVR
jgi:hypothetical protein